MESPSPTAGSESLLSGGALGYRHFGISALQPVRSGSPPNDDRVRAVGVVDDHVCLGLRVDLCDVDLFGDVVAIAMEAFGLVPSLQGGVTLDASGKREFSRDLDPDPEVPVVVILRPHPEDGVDDQHGVEGSVDGGRAMVLAGERVVSAECNNPGALWSRWFEKSLTSALEVGRVAVVALPRNPVVSLLPGIPPWLLKSSKVALIVGRPCVRIAAASSWARLVLPLAVNPSTTARSLVGRIATIRCAWSSINFVRSADLREPLVVLEHTPSLTAHQRGNAPRDFRPTRRNVLIGPLPLISIDLRGSKSNSWFDARATRSVTWISPGTP